MRASLGQCASTFHVRAHLHSTRPDYLGGGLPSEAEVVIIIRRSFKRASEKTHGVIKQVRLRRRQEVVVVALSLQRGGDRARVLLFLLLHLLLLLFLLQLLLLLLLQSLLLLQTFLLLLELEMAGGIAVSYVRRLC